MGVCAVGHVEGTDFWSVREPTLVLPGSPGPGLGRCARGGDGGKGGAGAIASRRRRRPCGRHHDVDNHRPRERLACYVTYPSRFEWGIEPSTCSLRAKVVTAAIWANLLVAARPLSVYVQECPPKRYPIVTQFVTLADEALSTAVQRSGPSLTVSREVLSCTLSEILTVVVCGSP